MDILRNTQKFTYTRECPVNFYSDYIELVAAPPHKLALQQIVSHYYFCFARKSMRDTPNEKLHSAKYRRLIDEFCELTKLDDPSSIYYGEPVEIEGATCALIYDEASDADHFSVYMNFGSAPVDRIGEIYRELLIENYRCFETEGSGFSICHVTNCVVYIRRYMLHEVSARHLACALTRLATKAIEWANTYFIRYTLRDVPPPSARP